jgi:hypothetical protein
MGRYARKPVRGRSARKTDGADNASPGRIQTALDNGKEVLMAKKKDKKGKKKDKGKKKQKKGKKK